MTITVMTELDGFKAFADNEPHGYHGKTQKEAVGCLVAARRDELGIKIEHNPDIELTTPDDETVTSINARPRHGMKADAERTGRSTDTTTEMFDPDACRSCGSDPCRCGGIECVCHMAVCVCGCRRRQGDDKTGQVWSLAHPDLPGRLDPGGLS